MGKKTDKDITIEEYLENVNIWYSRNNIIREKSELYYDFITSLLKIMDNTYLGSDVISTQDDMVNHFIWCLIKYFQILNMKEFTLHPYQRLLMIIYGISFIKGITLLRPWVNVTYY